MRKLRRFAQLIANVAMTVNPVVWLTVYVITVVLCIVTAALILSA